MPKPFTGVSANGHHHHFTLVDEDGKNVFHDPDGPAQLSEIGQRFMGGILDHFRALVCIESRRSTPQADVGLGFWAPVYKNYGWQNRTCTVRVASGGRFEFRGVDSACNPYLTQAALLTAGLDGVRRELDPGPPQQRTRTTCLPRGPSSSACPTTWARRSKRSRPTRSCAVRCRAVSTTCSYYKRDEWERYLAAVTDWERDQYRDRSEAMPCAREASPSHVRDRGIIYRNGGGEREVGRDMTRMLQAMKHRGPDSTGYALYRGDADTYVMHVKLSEASDDADLEQRLERQREQVEARMRAAGAKID